MPGACTVIVNPLSGSFSPQRLAVMLDFLAAHGFTPDTHEAKTPEAAAGIAREAQDKLRNPLIIVAAGDGTINAVVNGLSPGTATLAVVPFGTSNVLCRELGIMSPEEALKKIAAGNSRALCVGSIEKGPTNLAFLLMAGAGLDGLVVKEVRTKEKRRLKKGAYLLSALRALRSWEKERLTLKVGSRTLDCHTVIVCNGAKYGGNMVLAPGASIFEPEFRVICMKSGTRWGYLKILPALFSGKGVNGPEIETFTAKELEIRGRRPLQADGDYYFETPVRIRAIPDFLKIIV